jgi:uncharacterized membrane protein
MCQIVWKKPTMRNWLPAIFFVLLLLGPYYAFQAAGAEDRIKRGRWSLVFFFTVTGALHLLAPERIVRLIPPLIPSSLAAISTTGILEWLSGLGIVVEGTRRLVGCCLIVLLVALLPVSFQDDVLRLSIAGAFSPLFLPVVGLLQLWLIWWIWNFTVHRHEEEVQIFSPS